MLRRALISLAFAAGFVLLPSVARSPSAWADTPTMDAGAGSGSLADVSVSIDNATGSAVTWPKQPSDAVTNPAQHPAQAWSDEKAAQKTSWPLALWLAAVMLGKALAYGRDKLKGWPLVGLAAAWLAKGKGAMLLAAVVAVGAAGYNTVVNGGTWVAGLVAAGAALGGVLHSTTKGADTTGGAKPSMSAPS